MSDIIVILDDNESDAALAIRALERSGLRNQVAWLPSCEAGLRYLESVGIDLPVLLLLDLNFPGGMRGIDFLRKIRANQRWKFIPVIVLSIDQHSMAQTFGLGALAHLAKPIDALRLIESLRPLGLGWKLFAEI